MNTQTKRRALLQRAGALAGASLLPLAAKADAKYPERTVKIIVPFAAGGNNDVIARLVAEKLSKSMGQPFVVDNRTGAAGMIGVEALARAKPDGYTLCMLYSSVVHTNPYIYTKVPFNADKDIAYVHKVADLAGVLAVHPSVPVSNAKEFVAYVKANPGKLSFGSFGQGSYPHLMIEYLRHERGMDMVHVPYKGEQPVVQDVLGNQIQVGYASVGSMRQHIEQKKLKPIAVIAPQRIPAMPDQPTMAEQGINDEVFRMETWFGIVAPKGLPADIQNQLSREIAVAMALPESKALIIKQGSIPVAQSSPAQFTRDYQDWAPKWKKLADISGAKID